MCMKFLLRYFFQLMYCMRYMVRRQYLKLFVIFRAMSSSTQVDTPKMIEVTEGKATVRFTDSSNAFYNPVQEFNRDLTVAVLRQLSAEQKSCADGAEPIIKKRKIDVIPGLTVLDALSASGLRAIRFAKEVPDVRLAIANDFSETAVQSIKNNIELNAVDDIVSANLGDAVSVMYEHKAGSKRFDAVDLDPYGSPACFLDAAVQSVKDGGILMVTCTDMAVLCGNTPETCYAKYGGWPLKGSSAKETALRILLRCLESHATRYSRYIEPLLSVSIDFYIRLFVRLGTGAKKAKDAACKQSYLYQCVGCHEIICQPLATKNVDGNSVKFSPAAAPTVDKSCPHCNSRYRMAGPLWTDPMHNYEFLNRLLESVKNSPDDQILSTQPRIVGILSLMAEELHDVASIYDIPTLCKVIRCPMPRLVSIRSALLNAGYRVSSTHIDPTCIKTDAPFNVLWNILCAWKAQFGDSPPSLPENSPGAKICAMTPILEPDFALHPEAESKTKSEGLLRYQCNKGKNWGPKTKAKGSVHSVLVGAWDGTKKEIK